MVWVRFAPSIIYGQPLIFHNLQFILISSNFHIHRCTICQKRFLTGSVYYQHRLTHSGDRRYGCGECGKRFYRADALKNHEVSRQTYLVGFKLWRILSFSWFTPAWSLSRAPFVRRRSVNAATATSTSKLDTQTLRLFHRRERSAKSRSAEAEPRTTWAFTARCRCRKSTSPQIPPNRWSLS